MIDRRTLLLATPALLFAGTAVGAANTAPEPSVPPSGELLFDAFRKGSRIGQHSLRFEPQGSNLLVHIDVQFAVGFGPITLYRYRMQGTERWQDGRFDSIETATNDDGDHRQLKAQRTPTGVQITGALAGDRTLPPDALPLTHWAMQQMQAPLFNPETGADMGRFTAAGAAKVPLASGQTIPARAFDLSKPLPMTDWYDHSSVWAGLRALAKDGSVVEYRRA